MARQFGKNLVDESTSTEPWRNPEQGSQDTSKSSHELLKEPRAEVEPVSGKHSVKTHFPKDPNCEICLTTKITRASCRRRTGTDVPRVVHVGNLITADHKVLSEGSESRDIGFGNTVDAIVSVQKRNFAGDPEELNEVPGADEETKSRLHWQLLGIWQVLSRNYPGIILR